MTKEQIVFEARHLSPQQRAELIDDLLQLDDGSKISEAVRAEARRRLAEIDRGEAVTIDGEEVMREARQLVAKMRRT